MKYLILHCFALFLLICFQFSCSSSNERGIAEDEAPQLIVTDSLIVDYLGNLTMIDIKPDRSEYLMYDGQRKEFLRINAEGDIILSKNLSGDGKDSFGPYFYSAHFFGSDKLLFITYTGIYVYDLDFNLTEKEESPFKVYTNTISGSHVNLLRGNKLFTNRLPEKPSEDFFNQKDHLSKFPFLTVYDIEEKEIIAEQYIPKETRMIKFPGKYREIAPHSIVIEDVLYLLYFNSPEIYRFTFPDLSYIGKITLNPSEDYVQVNPSPEEDSGFGAFFNELAGSEYVHFSVSNGFFLTGYRGAAPQDKVDALPKNIVGGELFMALEKEYKIPYYQIIKGDEKLWEGHVDVQFKYKGGHLFADRNIHQPIVEEEKDYVAFYFYKIV